MSIRVYACDVFIDDDRSEFRDSMIGYARSGALAEALRSFPDGEPHVVTLEYRTERVNYPIPGERVTWSIEMNPVQMRQVSMLEPLEAMKKMQAWPLLKDYHRDNNRRAFFAALLKLGIVIAAIALGLAWLAGQDDLTQMFENDADIYSDFAGDFYHCAVWKPDDNEIPAIAKQVKAKRGFGKVCILGMGYGMGPTRFSDYADCDQQTAESAVNFYRRKYPKIPQFWYELQEAFYFAPSKGDKISIEAGWQGPASRAIRLPSGRLIRYPELQGTKDDMSIKWSDRSREHVWGGLLTENCCQSIARDCLTEAINRIEARGFHVAHHIYDQILIHCPERNAEEALEVGIEELTRREGWTKTIPLGAEGVIGDSYAKDN